MSHEADSPATSRSADEQRLHELGYAQELSRTMSGFSNFAVSFTIISILSGCLTLYGFGMNTGGPALIVWGWPFVGLMTLIVGLAMAEVCSSYPTAGGLYYWAAKLAPSNGAAWSWFTGWFNFLGQVAVTAGIDFGAAFFINAFLDLQFGFAATPPHTILIFGIVLALHGLLNTFGVKLVAMLNDISVWWHIVGVLVIVGALVVLPSEHQSASFVFTHFVNNTGWSSAFYVGMLGLLLAQYTFTGYDASAHMTEETHDAARSGPRGIVMSVVAATSRSTPSTSATISGSSAEVTSSSSRISGSIARARAIATRCCWPPESWFVRKSRLSDRPTCSRSCSARATASSWDRPRTCTGASTMFSSTVMLGNRLNCWNTMPTRLRTTRRRFSGTATRR